MTSPLRQAAVRRRLLQDDDEEDPSRHSVAVVGPAITPPRANSSLRDLSRPWNSQPSPAVSTRPRAPLSTFDDERSPGRFSTPAQQPPSSTSSSANKFLPSSGIAWLERERRRTETRLQAAIEHNAALQALLRQCYTRLGCIMPSTGIDESLFDRFNSESSVCFCPSQMCFS